MPPLADRSSGYYSDFVDHLRRLGDYFPLHRDHIRRYGLVEGLALGYLIHLAWRTCGKDTNGWLWLGRKCLFSGIGLEDEADVISSLEEQGALEIKRDHGELYVKILTENVLGISENRA